MTRRTRRPSPIRKRSGAVWPRSWTGFHHGTECSSGTTPGPNGSSAQPAISPITVLIATPTAGGAIKLPSSGSVRPARNASSPMESSCVRSTAAPMRSKRWDCRKATASPSIYLKSPNKSLPCWPARVSESFIAWCIPGSVRRPSPIASRTRKRVLSSPPMSATTAEKPSPSKPSSTTR